MIRVHLLDSGVRNSARHVILTTLMSPSMEKTRMRPLREHAANGDTGTARAFPATRVVTRQPMHVVWPRAAHQSVHIAQAGSRKRRQKSSTSTLRRAILFGPSEPPPTTPCADDRGRSYRDAVMLLCILAADPARLGQGSRQVGACGDEEIVGNGSTVPHRCGLASVVRRAGVARCKTVSKWAMSGWTARCWSPCAPQVVKRASSVRVRPRLFGAESRVQRRTRGIDEYASGGVG